MRRGRGRGALPLFLLASAAAHAGLIAWFPGPDPKARQARVEALEVVLLPPEPLPVARQEAAASPRARAPVPRAKPDSPPAQDRARTQQVLAVPEPKPSAEDAAVTPLPAPAQPERQARAAPGAAPEPAGQPAPVARPPLSEAAYLRSPAPRYPAAARRAGEQGTVMLRVLVARDGAPSRVELERSSGSRHLDGAALEAVRGWRFVPARRGTEAVESWVRVPVVFRLEGPS